MKKPKPVTLSQQYPQAMLVPADVADPYEPEKKLRVIKNAKEHPILTLHYKGSLTDAQAHAAHNFRAMFERATLGGATGVDYSKLRVDGGQPADPLSERSQAAFAWLNSVARQLDAVSYALLCQVAGEGMAIGDAARKWRGTYAAGGSRGEGWVRGRFIEAIDRLIDVTGQSATGRPRR